MKKFEVGTRVRITETGREGEVLRTYNDKEGAMWIAFDDGGQFVHYPDEVEAAYDSGRVKLLLDADELVVRAMELLPHDAKDVFDALQQARSDIGQKLQHLARAK